MQLLQRLAGALRLVGEAFVEGGDELDLRALALVDEALQGAGEFGDAVFEFGGTALCGDAVALAVRLRPP